MGEQLSLTRRSMSEEAPEKPCPSPGPTSGCTTPVAAAARGRRRGERSRSAMCKVFLQLTALNDTPLAPAESQANAALTRTTRRMTCANHP